VRTVIKPLPEDRLTEPQSRRRAPVGLLIAAAAVLAVIIWLLLFLRTERGEPPAPERALAPAPVASRQPAEPAVEPELPPAPDIPEALPLVTPPGAEPETPPPPLTLEESDAALRETLAGAGDEELLSQLLRGDHLVARGASVIDALSRGLVLRKLIPLAPPAGDYATFEQQGRLYMNPAGYRRYDSYANAIAGLDTGRLARAFHRFRPLLEGAYAELGYQGEDLDNALIRVLDRILATPEIRSPIAVARVEAIYKYRDQALEALPSLQKQLLRTGPDNVVKIKRQASALRAELLRE
jgi:hypothetical protein